jgi:hypothetical protein
MTLPGFTGETSVYKTTVHYKLATMWSKGSETLVRIPQSIRWRAVVGGARDANAEPPGNCTAFVRRVVRPPVPDRQTINRNQ